MKYSFLSLFVATLFLFGFGLNSPGVVFEVETTYHSGSSGVHSSQMSVEGKMLKMEILPGSDEQGGTKDEVIFRGDRKEFIVVDHSKKSYMVMDEAAMKTAAGALGEVQSQMDQMMKDLPDDVKKQIEEARKNGANIPGMPGAAPAVPKMTVNKSGQKGTKAGYPCVKYEVLKDGQKYQELWVTDWNNITGGDEAKAAFKEMSKFFKEMLESIPQIGGANPMDNSFAQMMSEIGGFPVVTIEFGDDGDLESESVLKSARNQRLDPADFEPPAGYKRMSMGPK